MIRHTIGCTCGEDHAMNYCHNCGYQLSHDARFCPRCGTPRQAVAAPAQTIAPVAPEKPAKQPMSTAKAFTYFGAALLVIIIVVGAYALGVGQPAWCSAATVCDQKSYDLGYNDGLQDQHIVSEGVGAGTACWDTLSVEHTQDNVIPGRGFVIDDESFIQGCDAALGVR
jgi:hypothetical protein